VHKIIVLNAVIAIKVDAIPVWKIIRMEKLPIIAYVIIIQDTYAIVVVKRENVGIRLKNVPVVSVM
jgi:hypothetical protein